jgi:hypothetical protein
LHANFWDLQTACPLPEIILGRPHLSPSAAYWTRRARRASKSGGSPALSCHGDLIIRRVKIKHRENFRFMKISEDVLDRWHRKCVKYHLYIQQAIVHYHSVPPWGLGTRNAGLAYWEELLLTTPFSSRSWTISLKNIKLGGKHW